MFFLPALERGWISSGVPMSAVLLSRSVAAAMVLFLLPRSVLPVSARLALVFAVGVGLPTVATFVLTSAPPESGANVAREFFHALVAAGTLSVPFLAFRVFARWARLQILPNAKLLETVLILAGLVAVFESSYPTRMLHAVAQSTGAASQLSITSAVELLSAGLGVATLLVLPLIVTNLFASVVLGVAARIHHFTLPPQANELVHALLMIWVLFWSYAFFESYAKNVSAANISVPLSEVTRYVR